MKKTLQSLIINTPYEATRQHWQQTRDGSLALVDERRSVGYEIFDVRRRFIPDFLVRLANGKTLVPEIKGEDSGQNKAKRDALDVWVRAVNERGGFGGWCWDVAFVPAQMQDILTKHSH